jgi:hypothetical protein
MHQSTLIKQATGPAADDGGAAKKASSFMVRAAVAVMKLAIDGLVQLRLQLTYKCEFPTMLLQPSWQHTFPHSPSLISDDQSGCSVTQSLL